jgi:hypothetical protein
VNISSRLNFSNVERVSICLLFIYFNAVAPISTNFGTMVENLPAMHYLATGCLPRICLCGKVFNEPLPSSGSIRHYTFMCLVYALWYLPWIALRYRTQCEITLKEVQPFVVFYISKDSVDSL